MMRTVLSTKSSSSTIIDLIQSLSLSSLYQLGLRALMYAAQGGHVDIIKLLLDSGSDVEKKDNVSTRRCMTIYACFYKVINELYEDCKKDIDKMR